MRPFRFAMTAAAVRSAPELAEVARRAEALGYSTLMLPDHLVEQLAPVSVLSVAAAATTSLRIGTFVLNNDLRHPAVLAQELASLDVLSQGRLEIGIGAGWNRPEYEASGIAFDATGKRIARLKESVAVLKGLMSDGELTYQGRFFRIAKMNGRPKPLQKPHPPFLIGGGGERLLRYAAVEADIVGLAPRATSSDALTSALAAATEEKIRWVREAAGERYAGLEINTYPSMRAQVTDRGREAATELASRLETRFGHVEVDDLLDSPHCFIGSIDSLTDKFRGLRERFDVSYILVGPTYEEFAPIVARLAGS